MSDTESQKESAVQNEQQIKSKPEIINDIIKISDINNLSIATAKEFFYKTLKELGNQLVADATTGWVDASTFKRELLQNYLCNAYNCTFSTEYPEYIKRGMTIG